MAEEDIKPDIRDQDVNPMEKTLKKAGSSSSFQEILKNKRIAILLIILILVAIVAGALVLSGGFGGDNGGFKKLDLSKLNSEARTPTIEESNIESTGTDPITGPLGRLTISPGTGSASQDVKISNTLFEDLVEARTSLSVEVGDAIIQKQEEMTYRFEISLSAEADSRQRAEEIINEIDIKITDKAYKDDKEVILRAEALLEVDLPELESGESAGSDVTLYIPYVCEWEMDVATGTGDIICSDIGLASSNYATGTGDVEVRAPKTLDGDYSAASGTGDVIFTTKKIPSGSFALSTGTGDLNIALSDDPKYGYDIKASTGTGSIDIMVPNLEYLENEENSVHARTKGYEDKEKKLELETSTGTGDITITA